MGLDIPDLDDRSYEELVTDARKRIPVYSDTWTDHNASDPGITMLEMLAWVAESNMYQLDRVTDRHVRKYLRLLGVEPDPPAVARTTVELDLESGASPKEVAAGTGLTAAEGGTERRFRTDAAVVVPGAELDAVISTTRDDRVDNTRANDDGGLHYRPFGPTAARGNAVYLGFDADPFRNLDRLDLHVDFHEADLPEPAEHGDEESTFEPTANVVWEHCIDYDRLYERDAWRPWDDDAIDDETREFYYGGTVSLPDHPDWTGRSRKLFGLVDSLYWIRARVETPGHEIPPQVDSIGTGVVAASHRATYHDEPLRRLEEGTTAEAARAAADSESTTTARPNQTFAFARAPVLEATVTVDGEEWEQRPDLDASTPDDEHYVLEHERGVVHFGDGDRGDVPEPDQTVRATSYVHGGGDEGNVGRDAEWRFAEAGPNGVRVSVRGPATGGRDAESTDDALARLKADLRRPYRAVTADDYRHIAVNTPGLRFGRAAVNIEPRDGDGDCARHGQATVAVVPYSPRDRDRPVASDGFLEAVDCHLQRHRLLTDEVVVTTPPYVAVDVEAVVEVAEGHAIDGRLAAVRDALDEFLDPLVGVDGGGWPFGRPVYTSEVYETIASVEGVDCVVDVELWATSPGSPNSTGIDVPGTALVYLDDAVVTAAGTGDTCGGWSR